MGELGEDLGFEGGDLWDGFDDHVDGGEIGELGGGRETGANRIRVGLREFLFGDVFGEELFGKGNAFVERGLGGIDEGDGDLGDSGGDEGDSNALGFVLGEEREEEKRHETYHLTCAYNSQMFDGCWLSGGGGRVLAAC